MMRQPTGTQQQFGDGPPHLSASYANNFQKDIDASEYSQAAIKAMANYKKRQSEGVIDSPRVAAPPQRPPMRRPSLPAPPVAPPMAPAMDPQMEQMMSMTNDNFKLAYI